MSFFKHILNLEIDFIAMFCTMGKNSGLPSTNMLRKINLKSSMIFCGTLAVIIVTYVQPFYHGVESELQKNGASLEILNLKILENCSI